ncbi:MAG: fatty acid desaturase [bacterium]|nr:fatty acid desaturase [bacterium]
MHPFLAILCGFFLAQLATIATTTYLHRGSTHRAVTFHPVVEFFFQLLLWLTTGINRQEWCDVHLYHHTYTDKPGDPHSPILEGLWHVQLGNLFYYRRATRDPLVKGYAKHIKLSWAERTIFRNNLLGLFIGTALLCNVVGFVPSLIIAGSHALLYLFFLNNLINGWCHIRGYKNYPNTPAFNNRLIALITGGEGLHNNHHENPGCANLHRKQPAGKFAEIDPGFLLIKLLCSLNLAKITRA